MNILSAKKFGINTTIESLFNKKNRDRMMFNEEQQEILLEFTGESLETLESIEPILVNLRRSSDPKELVETINLIFRSFHTLKGGAAFLDLTTIQKISHTTESLLQVFRTNVSKWQPQYIDVLIQSNDLISRMLHQTERLFNDLGFEEEAKQLIVRLEKELSTIKAQKEVETTPLQFDQAEQTIAPSLPLVEVLKQSADLFGMLFQHSWKTMNGQSFYREHKDLLLEILRHKVVLEKNQEQQQAEQLFDLPEPSEQTISRNGQKQASLQVFAQDSLEQLEKTEGLLLVLDKIADAVDIDEYLQSALRCIHSIKGNAGFLSFSRIEHFSHRIESVLDGLLEQALTMDAAVIHLLLTAIDSLRQAIVSLAADKKLSKEHFTSVQERLNQLSPSDSPDMLGNILVEMGKVEHEDIEDAIQRQQAPLGEVLVDMGKATQEDIKEALEQQHQEKKQLLPLAQALSEKKSQDIRVSLNKLDQLIDLVGELIICEAMISHHSALKRVELEDLKNTTRQLNRNLRELQKIAMSLRMVPVSSVFRKMVRVVHDAARKLGKQVDLKLFGEKTEVDKMLVELIADPLLHIIRNAVDHGIELPADRKKSGKSETGTIRLEAKSVGNEVWVISRDDGRGLDREKIIQRALDRGLISEAKIPEDEEIWKLIFEPGFSTKEEISDFSGRGVGMDVVKKNMEKLRGSIEIISKHNLGSTFILKIPLTLSIIDGLLVRVGDISYALPTIAIRETLQPDQRNIIKMMDGQELLRLRGRLVPILRLHKIYKISPEHTDLTRGMILVVELGEYFFCLFVDAVTGQQQVVVKNLPATMLETPHLAGCTILSDGQVGLILDGNSLGKSIDQHALM